jgi:GTP-binding protein EngB required for normal cell division
VSELEELATGAAQLAELAAGRQEAERAGRLAERLRAGRFMIAVAGEFKRGKSTLVNALVGEDVLPTGVLPLTAVATELVNGEPGAVVEFLDGSTEAIDPADVADFVTEARNPGNERSVARVEIRGRWPLLEPGVILVDTPGIGSVHAHNTDAARAALLDADGAVLVLSADAPISGQERDLLRLLAERRAPTFYVLNKIDHLRPVECDEVRRFVETVLTGELGDTPPLFALSARAARERGSATAPDGGVAGEFDDFVAALARFIDQDLVEARVATARRELARLGGSVRDAIRVERAALDLDAATLAGKVEEFRAAADAQRRAFDDDRTLLARDVDRLATRVGQDLASFARSAPVGHHAELDAIAGSAPRGELTDRLRDAIEAAVRQDFDRFRVEEAERAEAEWQNMAHDFRDRTQERIAAVRATAGDLFAVALPRVSVPAVAEQDERFFYLFLHIESLDAPIGRLLGLLLPPSIARRRAAVWARGELEREFDKHAGRVRWDLTQRLDAARSRFESAMRDELNAACDGILEAADRARALHRTAADARDRRRAQSEREEALAVQLADLAGAP